MMRPLTYGQLVLWEGPQTRQKIENMVGASSVIGVRLKGPDLSDPSDRQRAPDVSIGRIKDVEAVRSIVEQEPVRTALNVLSQAGADLGVYPTSVSYEVPKGRFNARPSLTIGFVLHRPDDTPFFDEQPEKLAPRGMGFLEGSATTLEQFKVLLSKALAKASQMTQHASKPSQRIVYPEETALALAPYLAADTE